MERGCKQTGDNAKQQGRTGAQHRNNNKTFFKKQHTIEENMARQDKRVMLDAKQ